MKTQQFFSNFINTIMFPSYHDGPHEATGRFDFVLANPPLKVSAARTTGATFRI